MQSRYQVCQEIFLQKRGKFQCGNERIILIHGHLLRKCSRRNCSPSTINLRMSAIKSFLKYAAVEAPEYSGIIRIDDVPSVSIDISDTHRLTSSDTRHPVLYKIMSIILSLNDNTSGLLHTSSIDSYSFLVKNVTPHTFRHSAAMNLLQAGVDISTIAIWLGHESIETTHKYVVADIEIKRKAMEKLDETSNKECTTRHI